MKTERWHIADTDGNPVCGAKDAGWETLAELDNIADADRRGLLCPDCDGSDEGGEA